MERKILCPGKRLYLLLEAIDNPIVYKRIEEESSRRISYDSLKQSFPNLGEEHVKQLYLLAKGEHMNYLGAYLLLQRYDLKETENPTLNISKTLAEHVKNCRKKAKCLDRFMLWTERKARAEMRESNVSEEGLPDLIKRIDFRTLDLGVF